MLPFLSEHLWQALVTGACPDAPASVHLAGWPARSERPGDDELLAEIAAVRDVVQLGRRARGEANLKLRQPLRRMYVRGASAAAGHADEIAEELRVKEVGFDQGPVARVQLLPNLRAARAAARSSCPGAGRAPARRRRALDDGRLRAAGEVLEPDEVIRGERVALEGWAIAEDDGISVASTPARRRAAPRRPRARPRPRAQRCARAPGSSSTDRIVVTLPAARRTCWLTGTGSPEVLAREIRLGDDVEITKAMLFSAG